MSEEDIETTDSTNGEEQDSETTEQVEETSANEESEDAAKLKELNKKLYERAKKAEAEAKELKSKLVKPEPKAETVEDDDLSQGDLIAVIRAEVSPDDVGEVKDYASLKKISVAEALKTDFVKSLLKEKEEQRKSAQVANTGGSKRTSSKVSDDALLAKAQTGEVSDEDVERLVRMRFSPKK